MRQNYLTSAFPAHALLRLWMLDDQRSVASGCVSQPHGSRTRQIIFVSSSAVFANVPGYAAYTRMCLKSQGSPYEEFA
jgi:3-dehydrosphinganine reductase